MGKILDLFNERHDKGQMYRNVPIKPDNSGNVHPLNYVYPDDSVYGGANVSMNDDVVLSGESVSLTRDIDRISRFDKAQVGARFLDRQIKLQEKNTFAYTRNYRRDNIKDHVDPTVHKPRHGPKISLATGMSWSSWLGEYSFPSPPDAGKLQGETAELVGQTHLLRLQSREGMVNNTGMTYLDIGAVKVRRIGTNWINKKLESITSRIQGARSRVFGTSEYDRPENIEGYLEQVFNANRGLKSPGGQVHGHIYLNLSPERELTYEKTFSTGAGRHEEMPAPGFRNYVNLKPTSFSIMNFSAARLFDKLHNKASRWAGRQVNKYIGKGVRGLQGLVNKLTGGRVRFPGNTASIIKGVGSKFLPRAMDISLLRSLKRFAVDIDRVIMKVRTIGSGLVGPLDPKTNLVPADLYEMYMMGSDPKARALSTVEFGSQNLSIDRASDARGTDYLTALKNYKSGNKKMSIGFDEESNTTQTPDGFTVFKAAKWDNPYYKDNIQVYAGTDIGRDIFRPIAGVTDFGDEFDTDSIDVIFRVHGREASEDVRFRAFIEDIRESVTPMYNENKYIGRYETFYTYDGVTRDLSFKLRMQAFSIGERDHIMQKMAYLTSLAYPESSGGSGPGYLTPLVTEVTIGRVYARQPCIVQSLSHTIEGDTSWDIDHQTPMSVVATLQVRLLDREHYTYDAIGNDRFRLYLKDASWFNPTSQAGTLPTENKLPDAVTNFQQTAKDTIRTLERMKTNPFSGFSLGRFGG